MENAPIVIDIGTSHTFAGYGGESEPDVSISSILGRRITSSTKVISPLSSTDFMIGSNVYKNSDKYTPCLPIDNRVITNFDDFTAFINTLITVHLNTIPKTHPLLLTVSPYESAKSKETILQIMMETFKVPALLPASSSQLVLHAADINSGIVVDAGETGTSIMPIFESYSIPYYSGRLDIGGRQITDQLRNSLTQRGYSLKTGTEREILRDMKSKICYISLDPVASAQDAPQQSFTTPDGADIKLTSQCFMCPEVLFKPGLCGCEQEGTSHQIAEVISKVDDDIRNQLATNIVLAGGSTMFPGYADRIIHDLSELLPEQSVNVVANQDRIESAWIGGSILASVGTFNKLYISQEEYDEYGASIIPLKMY